MNPELRELLAKLDEKEKEMSELKEKGEIRSAHGLLAEIQDLEKEIEVAKQLEKRSKEGVKKVEKEKDLKVDQFATLEYRQAFLKYISGQKELLTDAEVRQMGVGVNPTGGAVVPTTIASEIQRLLALYSPMRRLANVLTSSSNLTINMESNKATASWTAEHGTIGESNLTLAPVTFNAYKLATMVKLSNELILDNVVNIEGYIAEKVAQAFAIAEGVAFINGTGTTQPLGLKANIPAGQQYTSVTGATGAGQFAYADLVAVYNKILPAYVENATWLVSQDVFAKLMSLTDTTGRPLLMADVQNGGVYKLFQRPVEIDPNLDAFTTAGNTGLIFGDFKRAYQIVDRQAYTVKSSQERFIENDQTAIVVTKRVDGKPMDTTAVACMKAK